MTLAQGRIALAAATLLGVAAARADDSNFRPYLVGARAAGMGGAFTALADDGSGPYYNPGGLAFVGHSQLSLSGSVYGLVSGSFKDALGPGHDFNFSDFNTFPTSAAAVLKLGDTAAASISVFIPDALQIDDRDTLGSQQNAFFSIQQIQTVWTGVTYAHRFGRFGIGASLFFLLGTNINQLDLTAVSPTSTSQFATLSARVSETTYGGLASLGIRWDVSDQVRIGLSVFSPEVGSGSRRVFARVTAGDSTTAPGAPAVISIVNVDNLTATPTVPLRAQAGVAWTIGKLTLAADVIFLAPRDVSDDTDKTAQGLDRRVVRNAVLNGSVGGEYLLGSSFPLRAGFFTDFAASNSPVAHAATAANQPENTSHVNRYGASFSIGYQTEHTETDFGTNVTFGSGQDLIPYNLNFSDLRVTSATSRNLYLFLSSAYRF